MRNELLSSDTYWWVVVPKVAWSKDNVPPATPFAPTLAYDDGVFTLAWHRNVERDFWVYRLYRGTAV